MRLVFTPRGWNDYRWWQANHRSTLKRVNRLVDEALRDPTAADVTARKETESTPANGPRRHKRGFPLDGHHGCPQAVGHVLKPALHRR